MTNYLHKGDLPANINLGKVVAIDTETLGLNNFRDRLCLVQISDGKGDAHMIQFERGEYNAPNLKALLADNSVEKLFHFARFDLSVMRLYLGVMAQNVYCTRTASKFARTYTDNHGLKALCDEYLQIDISKKQQSSYWGNAELNDKQLDYAANDVAYLHRLQVLLNERLKREGRLELALASMKFLPLRAELDIAGWADDIFSH